MVSHSRLKYDYRLIINELAKQSEGKIECIWKNTEKFRNFSIPIEKELENDEKSYLESYLLTV